MGGEPQRFCNSVQRCHSTQLGEHAKPGEAILRAGNSALSIHKAHRISIFAQLISLCCDMGKKRSSSDTGNLTNLGCGLV